MSSRKWALDAEIICMECGKVLRGHVRKTTAEHLGDEWDEWMCLECMKMKLPSVAKCIVCKRELDFEVTEMDRIIDDNIWYCDECNEIMWREVEEEYER